MKFGDAFTFITTFSILFIESTSPVNVKEDKFSVFYKYLWPQGTIPYAIISVMYRLSDIELNVKLQNSCKPFFLYDKCAEYNFS